MDIITIVVLVFGILGALDRILGGRLGLGKEFEKGFSLLGAMALSMIGMAFNETYLPAMIVGKIVAGVLALFAANYVYGMTKRKG